MDRLSHNLQRGIPSFLDWIEVCTQIPCDKRCGLLLETEDSLGPGLALKLIVAWRVPWLTMLGRTCPDLACDVVFAEEEWRSVWTIVRREPAAVTALLLNEIIRRVAYLGGHLGRKHDGPPGAQVLWIGIQRIRGFAMAWQAFGPRPAKE
jgi:Transposase Tn5 dimerisation domain